MARSGRTIFIILIVVAGLGWGAGAVGLQLERAEIRRAEAELQAQLLAEEQARKAAEAKRIAEHDASWRLPVTKAKNWYEIQDPSGELVFQYRYLDGTCPTTSRCVLFEVNPKYSCVATTFTLEWLDAKEVVVKTTSHTRYDLTATQTFRWTMSSGPAKGGQYVNLVKATCEGKTF